MKTIYNAQGEAKTCDAVDAREHIATGRWFAEAPVIDAPAADAPAADAPAADAPKAPSEDAAGGAADASRMNKVALLAHLASLGIDAPETATKAELLKLLA